MLMPPQQQSGPSGQPPYGAPDPYAFIMNNQPQKKGGFNFNGAGMGARIALVAGLLIMLIIIYMVASSFLNKSSNDQTQRLLEVTQAQSELIRVSRIAEDDAVDLKTRTLAYNTRLSTESSQRQVKALLAKRGKSEKSVNKKLGATKNAKTDAALEEAKKNNRFDETFTTIINGQLVAYQKLLKSAHDAGSANEKTVLATSFESTKYLVAKKSDGSTKTNQSSTPPSTSED